MTDARFEDGAEKPLRLHAQDAEDLTVISALVQDAVVPVSEIRYDARRRRLDLLISRFRHEWRGAERVQSVLSVEDAGRVASQGVDRGDADLVLAILALDWSPGPDGAGRIEITLAGDGAIAAEVECLNVALTDVTRPYRAAAGRAPDHGL